MGKNKHKPQPVIMGEAGVKGLSCILQRFVLGENGCLSCMKNSDLDVDRTSAMLGPCDEWASKGVAKDTDLRPAVPPNNVPVGWAANAYKHWIDSQTRGYSHTTYAFPKEKKDEFEWEMPKVKEEDKFVCPSEATIILDYEVHEKIQAMTKAMGNDEWLGWLLGDIDGEFVNIVDLYVPEQKVSAGSVDVKEDITLLKLDEGIVLLGTVHSHGYSDYGSSHSPGFSGTDEENIIKGHPISLLTNGNGKYTVKSRLRVPCGHWMEVPGQVHVSYPSPKGMEEFLKKGKAKCSKQSYVYEYKSGAFSNFSREASSPPVGFSPLQKPDNRFGWDDSTP